MIIDMSLNKKICGNHGFKFDLTPIKVLGIDVALHYARHSFRFDDGPRDDHGCRATPFATTRPVRPGARARCVRRRLRGAHQGRKKPRHHHAGAEDSGKPGPPGCRGRRSADGRWRRHSDPDARCAVPRGNGQAGHHLAATRRIRRGHDLSAQGARLAPGVRRGDGARHQGRGPGAAGLARRAGEPRHADVAHGACQGADHPPGVHRPRGRRHRAGRAGAQALRHSQDRQRQHPGAGPALQQRVLRAQHEQSHSDLQGTAAGRPSGHVLPRSGRRALRLRAGPGAPALLDQHLPRMAAGAPLPLCGAQRRDQHRQGQLQLDARARRRDVVAGAAG